MKSILALWLTFGLGWLAVDSACAETEQEAVIADFESESYGEWKTSGDAFGSGPAAGTLPGQMPVSGFRGQRLVNSFFRGDATTGTLTSPPLKLERDYLTFLIGGGGHEGKTCLNLIVAGKVVRSSTGSNTAAGGSEELALQFWDVREFKGQQVVLEVVDQATGGWGHVNVDHILQTNSKPKIPNLEPRQRTFTVSDQYLLLPIQNGAKTGEIVVEIDGTPIRRYTTELAVDAESIDWYAYLDLGEYRGRSAKLIASRATEAGFELIRQDHQVPGSESLYDEPLRPQFHFSQKVGWNNDPNGMVYLNGEWHLFFQHNPVGWNWGNMTWGHAVSPDLVHWKQLPNAFFPKIMLQGDAFSGGAIIDSKNTSGWKTGNEDVLVAFLTDTGAGESVAYSHDRGRSFTWYARNPIVTHRGRDPKVFWYSYERGGRPLDEAAQRAGGHWVMAVYNEDEPAGRNISFHTSSNLKDWKKQSHITGYYECPELFELPVDGAAKNTKWVLFAADARYAIGTFDGLRFTPEHDEKHQLHWGRYYASQTFENAPSQRRIQIGWAQIAMPGMPFNQTFSFPHELSLRSAGDGVRLFGEPVSEIETIHGKKHAAKPGPLAADTKISLPVIGQLFDVRATFELGDAREVGLDLGGNRVAYDAMQGKLGEAPLKPKDGRITVRVLVDRPMLEIGGNDGRVVITLPREHLGEMSSIDAFATGGSAKLLALEVVELKSIWK